MGEQPSVFRSAEGTVTPLTTRPRRVWHDLSLLALLVLMTAGLRTWQVDHAEVAARDSIGFIREAWRLRDQPWGEVTRTSEQHPGYPMLLLAVSWPVRQFGGGSNAAVMQLSAHLTSALASVLLVFPLYYLGKLLFNRTVGFWATVLFQCLPTSSRTLADGLSEATFLLFAGTSLLLAVLAVRGQSKLLFGLTGLASGLAYLTRPEGAIIIAATGAVLVGMQVRQSSRRPWQQFLACGFGLLFGWGLIGGPFMYTIRHFTVKNTGLQIIQPQLQSTAPMLPDQKELQALKNIPPQADQPVQPAQPEKPKAVSWSRRIWNSQMVWGLRKLGSELHKGFFYVTWFPALLGLWWYRARIARAPGQWVLLLVSIAMLVVLYRVASYMRYLSDRHALLLIYCGCIWSTVGFLAIGRRFAALARRWPQRQVAYPSFGVRLVQDSRFWSGLILLALIVATFVKDVEPLHANRRGFRDAGDWIAEHMSPSDELIDPYCWTDYYAGRVFLDEKAPDVSPGQAHICYIVLDESGNEHPRLRIQPEIISRARQGEKAFESKKMRKKDGWDVCVYAVPMRP
jgi:4-amino-4-deoxy-L-arabinose transferase-like glycosyltransferase